MDATYDSPLIKLSTLEYPVSVWEFRTRHPNTAFGDVIAENALDYFGYAVVAPVERPAGDAVTEGAPVKIDDQWTQTWDVRAYNAEELAQLLVDAKNSANWSAQSALTDTIESGVTCAFADGDLNLKLTLSNITHLGAEFDPLILGSGNKVVEATSAEASAAYQLLRGKRQLLLAAYRAQVAAIEATTVHTDIPSDADIRTAIVASVQ